MIDLTPLARACFICHRTAPITHGTYVRVGWPDGSVQDVCDDCVEKADRDEPLDEELDLNPEGDPTRNGAFG